MTAPDRTPDRASDRDRDAVSDRRSLILDVSTRAVFHAAVLFAVWLLAAGHNQPGGGFVGGLTISAALVLAYANGGVPALRSALPVRPLVFLGVGMLVAQATAVVPLLLGANVLESRVFDFSLPLFGEVHLATALFFDIGVLLIVIGLVAKALDTLGAADPDAGGDPPPRSGDSGSPAP